MMLKDLAVASSFICLPWKMSLLRSTQASKGGASGAQKATGTQTRAVCQRCACGGLASIISPIVYGLHTITRGS